MRTTFTQIFAKCAMVAFTCFAGMAHAATFTAVSSGSWSSSATWSGGTAPGGTIGGIDNVIINSGVNVSMDMDVEVTSILSSIEVNGTLNSSSSAQMLDINNGNLSGNGTLNLHNLRFGVLGSMSFNGDANVDNMWNNNVSLSMVSQTTINDTLFLEAGTLTLGSGGFLTIETDAVIHVDGGAMTLGSGLVNNSNDYSVVYVGASKNTGLELTGSGLSDTWINLDDNTQSLSITGNVSINGDLHQNTGMINLNGGTLMLMDDYMRGTGAMLMGSATSNLMIMTSGTLSSTLVFEASTDQIHDLWIENDGGSVSLASDLTISGTLTVEDGDLMSTSGTLMMANGSEIEVGDGHLVMSGGTFNGTNDYSVTYNGSTSTVSGVELTGSGMGNLSLDMDNQTDSVEIMNNISIDGNFELENGTFDMNGYDVVIDGSFTSSTTGWFNGDANSDLTFSTATALNDTIWFDTNNHTIGDFIINTGDASYLMLGNELRVENLTLTNGGVMVSNSDLWINSTGTIAGADENKYVMIMGSGNLNMRINVSAPYTMFPVGTDESYSPVGLQQNSGIDRYFRVNVVNGVWSSGTTGANNALTESVVDRTWNVSLSTAATVDVNMIVQWDNTMEVNGFDRTDAYISHYTSGMWDTYTTNSAITVSGMYQLEREGLTSLSPFAVVDEAASVAVEEEYVEEPLVQMYPNPVNDLLTCVVNITETTTVDLVDLTGKVLYSKRLEGTASTMSHSIDFSALPKGVYFIRYNAPSKTTSYKVVKA